MEDRGLKKNPGGGGSKSRGRGSKSRGNQDVRGVKKVRHTQI